MKNKVHKFELKPVKGAEGRIAVGANMRLFMDGKLVKGVTSVNFDVQAGKIAKVRLELVGQINATMWALGNYHPVQVKASKKAKR